MRVLALAVLSLVVLAVGQQVSLIPDNSDVGLSVQFVLSNNGKAPLTFITWNTPLEGIFDDYFTVVSSSGRRAEYIGKLAKRASTPEPSEFVTLDIGQSVSARVDLQNEYALWNDTFTVSFSSQLGIAASSILPGQTSLPAVTFIPLRSEGVESRVLAVFPRPAQSKPTMPGDYISCNPSQASQVDDAVVNAHAISKAASAYVYSSCDQTYITWFGQFDGTELRPDVGDHFDKITQQIESNYFSINCQPPACSSPSVFAYVYPTDTTFTVYLCGQFWRASGSVTYDSQPGTLVHEFSHFRVIAGTQDYVYGTSGALNLAKTDPERACFNADNHEYFAEVLPHCP